MREFYISITTKLTEDYLLKLLDRIKDNDIVYCSSEEQYNRLTAYINENYSDFPCKICIKEYD